MTYTRSKMHAFTYKEGLLSRIAHDLTIEVTRFWLRMSEQMISAEFDLKSLSPLGAMVSGKFDPRVLAADDLAEIKKTMQREVLEVERYPRGIFTGIYAELDDRLDVKGELELHGRKRPLAFTAVRSEGLVRGELELKPSEFGIAPYRAMLGTLRLQDRVRVRFELDEAEIRSA
jgi:hypothetical protein